MNNGAMEIDSPLYIVKIVVIVVGLALLGWGYYESPIEISKNYSATAKGTIIGFAKPEINSRGSKPVVEYKTISNKTIVFTDNVATNGAGLFRGRKFSSVKTGELVEVIYNPSDPRKASINTFYFKWFNTIFIFTGALFFLILGIFGKQAPENYEAPWEKFLNSKGRNKKRQE